MIAVRAIVIRMKNKKEGKVVKKSGFVLIVFAFVLGLCNVASAAAKDTVVVADQYDATTFDPVAQSDLPSIRAARAVYNTLLDVDEQNRPKAALVTSWEFLSDTEIKLSLRKDVVFHNGEKMTAHDVKYTIDRAIGPAGTHVKTFVQDIKDVEVIDDYTVVIRLKQANYAFFPTLAHCWTSVLNKKAVDAAGDSYGMNPVGTGPFKFVSWQKGNKYVLERFDNYWGEKAKFKVLEVRSVPEGSSRTIELESGWVDLAFPISNNDLKRIEDNQNLTLYRIPQNSVTYMGINCSKKPFDDVRVRQALHAALDTVGIQKAVWRGVGKVPNSLVPPEVRYSIDREVTPHKQDVELAKKLLEEAGVKDLVLEIWTNERKERVDMAQIIQAQFADVGITAKIQVLEWGAFLNGLRENTHDLFILGKASVVSDPDYSVSNVLESNGSTNYAGFKDPELDAFLAGGRHVPDGPEREAVYKKMQLYINEQVPMIYLHNDESIVGAQRYIKGFVPSATEVHSFHTIDFEE
jgi:peptide/nickel transport system substrate-binding protein